MLGITARVAVVDDEEPVRTGLSRLLRSVGYETSVYASGPDFLESLTGGEPDCVVLDLSMPGMSGHEVMGQMRSRGSCATVVIITGREAPGDRNRALGAGAKAFLRKPIDDSDLISAIEKAIGPNRVPVRARSE
jgi:FixJ family two-component response regulator